MPGSCLARREGTPWIFTAVNRPNAILSPPTRILNNARFAAGLSLCRQPKKKSPRTAGSTSARRPPAHTARPTPMRRQPAAPRWATPPASVNRAAACMKAAALRGIRPLRPPVLKLPRRRTARMGNACWASAMKRGRGCPKAGKTQLSFTARLPTRVLPRPSATWAGAMSMARGFRKTPAAPSTGTVPLLYRKMPGQSVVSASAI